MSEPILVLGMHRSGTSSVAGVLAKLGGGSPKTLMPPNATNPRGFFESSPLVAFHDELLASANSSWDDWRKFNPSWFASPEVEAFHQRAKGIFAAEFSSSFLPVLKDPRVCRFAPFWLDHFKKELGAKPRVIIPIRSPLEVAQSLYKIYRMPLAKGLLLWLRHVLDAEDFSRNEPRSIFTWNDFLSDWRRTVEKMGVEADIAWPRLSDRASSEIERFLGDELVHQRIALSDLANHSKVHEWTLGAYEALLELACNASSNSAIEKLNEIKKIFDRSCAMFGSVLADEEINAEELRSKLRERSEALDKLSSRAESLQVTLSTAQGENERFAGELRSISAKHDEVLGRAAELSHRLESTLAALAKAQGQRKKLSLTLAGLEVEMNRRANEVAQLEAQKNHLIVVLADQEASSATVRVQAEENAAEFERLRAAAKAAEEARNVAEREGAARVAAIETTYAAALADGEKRTEAEFRILREQLVEAEARLAQASRTTKVVAWKRVFLGGRQRGEASLLLKSGLFDEDWYKNQYPDAVKSRLSPVEHFLKEGYLRGYQPNPFFEPHWYLERYGDVRRSGVNPLVHFLLHGANEGRDPGPKFQTKFYLSANPDVRDMELNPLTHYLTRGHHEGRRPVPNI